MIKKREIEEIIGLILLVGTLISSAIVLIGGVFYLFEYGSQSLNSAFIQSSSFHNIRALMGAVHAFSSIGIIELGILALVATQTLRVALLCWYYITIKDYWFISISVFVLIVLIYSSFWRQ